MKNMDWRTVLGFAAGGLTTISYVPQVIKTWKSKSTNDISAGMFITLTTGILLWVLYGICISSLPVIITNSVSFILGLTIVAFKIKNG